MPSPSPSPLTRYLRVQVSTEREIRRMLRRSYANLDHQLNVLSSLDKLSVSQTMRMIQLREAQRAIKRELDQTMDQVAGEIRNQRRVAAAAAGETIADSAAIFSAAGLSPGEVKLLQRSIVVGAEHNVQAAIARLKGASYVPLADSVYKTKQLISGSVSRIIQDHLARGSSARDLAKDVRSFVNPNVRGGVKYASMRLARTELNNAFHAVQKEESIKSPFVEKVKWELSGSHDRPDECNEYADHPPWDPIEVPDKPHPQCLCFTTPITPRRSDFIKNFNEGMYDEWLDDQGVEVSAQKTASTSKSRPVLSGRAAAERLAKEIRPLGVEDQEARDILRTYTGSGYKKINRGLRRGTELDEDQQDTVRRLKAMGQANHLPFDVQVARGIDNISDVFPDGAAGTEFVDRGFMSTTLDVDDAKNSWAGAGQDLDSGVIRMTVPKGTPSIPVDQLRLSPDRDFSWGSIGSEAEIILMPGTKMRVVGDVIEDGVRYLDVEVLP